MQGSKRDSDVKNSLLDSVRGEGRVICEDGFETYTLPYIKMITSVSVMYDAGNPKPVLRGNPEG